METIFSPINTCSPSYIINRMQICLDGLLLERYQLIDKRKKANDPGAHQYYTEQISILKDEIDATFADISEHKARMM